MCIRKIVATLIAALIISTLSLCYGKNLKNELRQLDNLRNGPKTPLDEVDRRGEQLLNKYSNPKDRGQIYYQLAHIHAQSSLLHPEKVINYAHEALQCPLEPPQQMRLHTYWGDALTVRKVKKSFAETRQEAAVVYLRGLRRLVDLNLHLPEKPPETELMTMFDGPDEKENRRKGEEQWARRQQIDFQREMIMHRKVLQGQIVGLYGRRPIATEELKDLATGILGEGKELDRLMAAVNETVATLPPEENQTVAPVAAAVPESWPKYLYLSIALGIGGLVAVVLWVLSRWSRARQKSGPSATQKN